MTALLVLSSAGVCFYLALLAALYIDSIRARRAGTQAFLISQVGFADMQMESTNPKGSRCGNGQPHANGALRIPVTRIRWVSVQPGKKHRGAPAMTSAPSHKILLTGRR